jgi:hypothetical protein
MKFSESFRGILKTFIARGNEYMPGTLPGEIRKAVLKEENSHETKRLESVGGKNNHTQSFS